MTKLDYASKGMQRGQRQKRTLEQKLDRIGLIVVLVLLFFVLVCPILLMLLAVSLAIAGMDVTQM